MGNELDGSYGHERRIGRLEQEMGEIQVSSAKSLQSVEFLTSKVTEGIDRIADKIDSAVVTQAATATQLAEIATTVSDHNHFIHFLEASRKSRAETKDYWKKALVGLFVGAGAIGIKELAVFVFSLHH